MARRGPTHWVTINHAHVLVRGYAPGSPQAKAQEKKQLKNMMHGKEMQKPWHEDIASINDPSQQHHSAAVIFRKKLKGKNFLDHD